MRPKISFSSHLEFRPLLLRVAQVTIRKILHILQQFILVQITNAMKQKFVTAFTKNRPLDRDLRQTYAVHVLWTQFPYEKSTKYFTIYTQISSSTEVKESVEL
jgi:hypothetical protein